MDLFEAQAPKTNTRPIEFPTIRFPVLAAPRPVVTGWCCIRHSLDVGAAIYT